MSTKWLCFGERAGWFSAGQPSMSQRGGGQETGSGILVHAQGKVGFALEEFVQHTLVGIHLIDQHRKEFERPAV